MPARSAIWASMSKKGKKQGLEKSPALLKTSEKTRQVASDGKVGKGKPPEAFKWRPGQSGNPSGRPSAHRAVIVASVKEMLAVVDPKLNKSLFERLLEQCARRALQGSKWHMGVLLDYGLGKPTQMLEHAGSIDLRSALAEARKRAGLDKALDVFLPAPANGHSTPQGAWEPAATAEQGAEVERREVCEDEQPAKPKIRVEPWAN